jgi:hypothetical protein
LIGNRKNPENGIENFGNLAITVMVTHGFASCPHEQFALIGFQRTGSKISLFCKETTTIGKIVKINPA